MKLGIPLLLLAILAFAVEARALSLPDTPVHGVRWGGSDPALEIHLQVQPDGAADWWEVRSIVADDARIAVLSWPESYGTVLLRARVWDPASSLWSVWSAPQTRPIDGERVRAVPEPSGLLGLLAGVGLLGLLARHNPHLNARSVCFVDHIPSVNRSRQREG